MEGFVDAVVERVEVDLVLGIVQPVVHVDRGDPCVRHEGRVVTRSSQVEDAATRAGTRTGTQYIIHVQVHGTRTGTRPHRRSGIGHTRKH